MLTCPPCTLPQAGQTPLEAARDHNNPEVALLLTKAPQVGLAALSAYGLCVATESLGATDCNVLKPVQTGLLTRQWEARGPQWASRMTSTRTSAQQAVLRGWAWFCHHQLPGL